MSKREIQIWGPWAGEAIPRYEHPKPVGRFARVFIALCVIAIACGALVAAVWGR